MGAVDNTQWFQLLPQLRMEVVNQNWIQLKTKRYIQLFWRAQKTFRMSTNNQGLSWTVMPVCH